jgi:hypothetical protein
MLAGCGSGSHSLTTAPGGGGGGTVPGTAEDRQQISTELAQNPQFVEDGLWGVGEESIGGNANGPTIEGTLNAVQPIRFSRTIRRTVTSFEYAFSDTDSTGQATRAVVTVHRDMVGTFNLQVVDDSTFSTRKLRKPLHDEWVRRILLERANPPGLGNKDDDDHDGDDDHGKGDGDDEGHGKHGHGGGNGGRWRIAGSSGVVVTSDSSETRIVSLHVQGAALDTTITDPLSFFYVRRILQFVPDDSVTLTATTLRNDDVVVLEHRSRHLRLHNNGDNTYTGVFRSGFLAGVNHAGVNALSHGTLYDDQAPYDSQSWLFPYVVQRLDVPWANELP